MHNSSAVVLLSTGDVVQLSIVVVQLSIVVVQLSCNLYLLGHVILSSS